MTVDVARQGAALLQALALGAGLGALYDLFRILRVRVPPLRAVLDLLFWPAATVILFGWSRSAWGGPVRLYGALFCLAGGGGYFALLSRPVLRLGYRLADLTPCFWGF